MSVRAADERFLVPVWPQRVALLEAPSGWKEALVASGAKVVLEQPDLVVAGARRAADAAAFGAPAVLLHGRRSGPLRRAGYATRTIVARPGALGPRLLVPLDARLPLAYAFSSRRPDRGLLKRVGALAALAAARLRLPPVETIVVASRSGRPALLEAAAAAAGFDLGDNWYLVTGDGDDLQRAVWLCFADGVAGPAWAVKFSRVRGNSAPFDREGEVAAVVEHLPAELRRHVPRRVARFELHGLDGAVETAAAGVPLQVALSHQAEQGDVVDRIAGWTVELAQASRGGVPELAPELARLERDVLPSWQELGAPSDLARRVGEIRPVLQHNDLGTWNIAVDGKTFTVLDWESSRLAGLPLWDIAYFLTDALTARGLPAPALRVEHMLALLRGEAEESERLFGWIASAARAAGVSQASVGPIVTLGWLHHGLSHLARASRAAGGATILSPSDRGPLQQLGQPWLEDPSLGVNWNAFARWAGQTSLNHC